MRTRSPDRDVTDCVFDDESFNGHVQDVKQCSVIQLIIIFECDVCTVGRQRSINTSHRPFICVKVTINLFEWFSFFHCLHYRQGFFRRCPKREAPENRFFPEERSEFGNDESMTRTTIRSTGANTLAELTKWRYCNADRALCLCQCLSPWVYRRIDTTFRKLNENFGFKQKKKLSKKWAWSHRCYSERWGFERENRRESSMLWSSREPKVHNGVIKAQLKTRRIDTFN